MVKFKCPYTFPHKSRVAKARYICAVGGYSRSLDGRWPIEFCVGAWQADTDFNHLWEKYSGEYIPESAKATPEHTAAYYQLAMRLHKQHENDIWDWGQEDAARSLNDGDWYRMLWDGTMLDVTLELHGRGGKHLVIADFEGNVFTGMSDDELYEGLMRQVQINGFGETWEKDRLCSGYEWSDWTDKQVNTLYRYVRQCEVDFTIEKASAEVEYQGAFCFFNNIVEGEWETALATMQEHDEYVEHARVVFDQLRKLGVTPAIEESLIALAQGAGVHVNGIEFS